MKTIRVLLLLMVLSWLVLPTSVSAFYNPSTGRWLSRDLIEENGGLNVYAFVGNEPLNRYDWLGLQYAPEAPGPPAKPGPCEKFDTWYQKEIKDTSWMKELPNCPCKISVGRWACSAGSGIILTVSSDQGAGWALDPGLIVLATRKGVAANCIRSKPTESGAAQECCYDSDGKLITGGPGAGTTDRGTGWGHKGADWDPYRLAVQCDKLKGGNSCILKYLEVRPVNNGNKCDKNEPSR